MLYNNFEEFLQFKHADEYKGTKDRIEEYFDYWISELEPYDLIRYADEYANIFKVLAIK